MVAFATDERMQPPPIHPVKICPSEGTVDIFIEPHTPAPQLVIYSKNDIGRETLTRGLNNKNHTQ